MAAIAKWGFFSVFTRAQKFRFGFLSGKFHWLVGCTFMATVTKRLGFATTAFTPQIAFTGFEFDPDWLAHKSS
jgi:hypothetical protein